MVQRIISSKKLEDQKFLTNFETSETLIGPPKPAEFNENKRTSKSLHDLLNYDDEFGSSSMERNGNEEGDGMRKKLKVE